ncbi:hypothetical protein HYY75_12605, partial [bacterium]|nr:hypothetical protein [bacterium]
MDLFKRNFNLTKPPPKSFINSCFQEYKRQDALVEGCQFIRDILPWFPDDPELMEQEESARKDLYDQLLKAADTQWKSA